MLYLAKPVPGVSVATVASARAGQLLSFVGYGRTTPGPSGGVASGDRKSVSQSVLEVGHPYRESILTEGRGGGLCTGDSGGALMAADNGRAFYGVLSHFKSNTCAEGNRMVFTSSAEELPFLRTAFKCAQQAAAAFCVASLTKNPSLDTPQYCAKACASAGLAPNRCGGDAIWSSHCDGTCVRPGCPSQPTW